MVKCQSKCEFGDIGKCCSEHYRLSALGLVVLNRPTAIFDTFGMAVGFTTLSCSLHLQQRTGRKTKKVEVVVNDLSSSCNRRPLPPRNGWHLVCYSSRDFVPICIR
jgi:hypothetical protein